MKDRLASLLCSSRHILFQRDVGFICQDIQSFFEKDTAWGASECCPVFRFCTMGVRAKFGSAIHKQHVVALGSHMFI